MTATAADIAETAKWEALMRALHAAGACDWSDQLWEFVDVATQ